MSLLSTMQIESTVAESSSSFTYKVWRTRLQKYVLIKEQTHAITANIEEKRIEHDALKNVKSPYVVQALGFIAKENKSYTIMEFVEGESFDKALRSQQRFLMPQILRWYKQMAIALHELHKKGVYHRDIKPSNIMLTPMGNICLIDFNAAYFEGLQTVQLCRSKGYSSPEQMMIMEKYEKYKRYKSSPLIGEYDDGACCVGDVVSLGVGSFDIADAVGDDGGVGGSAEDAVSLAGIVDWARSDIYSLGATMKRLLENCHDKCFPVITEIIGKSMQHQPENRYENASELAAALRKV